MTASARLDPWRRKNSARSRMTATEATDSAARAYSTHSAPARVNRSNSCFVMTRSSSGLARKPAREVGGLGFERDVQRPELRQHRAVELGAGAQDDADRSPGPP